MHVNDVVTHLEMTAPDQLVVAGQAPRPVRLREVGADAVATVKDVHDRLALEYCWRSLAWTDDQWATCLTTAGIRTWIAEVDGDPMGLLQLHQHSGGEVEFDFFGVVPEFVGKGYGGHFLSLATEVAWGLPTPDGGPVRRVWLKTSCYDHPNARLNYRARGYRDCFTEIIPRDLVTAGG